MTGKLREFYEALRRLSWVEWRSAASTFRWRLVWGGFSLKNEETTGIPASPEFQALLVESYCFSQTMVCEGSPTALPISVMVAASAETVKRDE